MDSFHYIFGFSNWRILFPCCIQSTVPLHHITHCHFNFNPVFQQVHHENFSPLVQWYWNALNFFITWVFLCFQIRNRNVFYNSYHVNHCLSSNLRQCNVLIRCDWRRNYHVFFQCICCKLTLDFTSSILHQKIWKMDEIWKEEHYPKISQLNHGRLSVWYGEEVRLNTVNNVVYVSVCVFDSFRMRIIFSWTNDILLGR